MFSCEKLITMLGNVPHFKRLSSQAICDIVLAGHVRHFKAGSILFHEGEACAGLFVLFSGHVHLYKMGVQGQEAIINSIKPVIMFNEVPVLDGGVNTVSAAAVQDCVVWVISSEKFHHLMDKYPELGTGLLKIMAKRNRLLFNRYEDLFSRPVIARLAKVLIYLSDDGKKSIDRYQVNNQKLAALAATVPEAISRSIKTMKEDGIIEVTRDELSVRSIHQLYTMGMIDEMGSRYSQQADKYQAN